MKVLSAEFVTTAVDRRGWPPPELPEIAFVGRSNVGKSSMLNRLAGRKGLARVSGTPGRTRALNFFDLQLAPSPTQRLEMRFCDLPGYGFAKVSKRERQEWARLIEGYLAERDTLRAVVVIVDARVGPTADDRQMLDWLDATGVRALVVATKIDKLPKAKRVPRLRQLDRELGFESGAILGFSAEEGLGRDELWRTLAALATAKDAADQ